MERVPRRRNCAALSQCGVSFALSKRKACPKWDEMAYIEINELSYNLEDIQRRLLLVKWLPSVGPVFYCMSLKTLGPLVCFWNMWFYITTVVFTDKNFLSGPSVMDSLRSWVIHCYNFSQSWCHLKTRCNYGFSIHTVGKKYRGHPGQLFWSEGSLTLARITFFVSLCACP